MSAEERLVTRALTSARRGVTISDLEARVLAARWHGGQASALYGLASCGAIRLGECLLEINAARISAGAPTPEWRELDALAAYVYRHGGRGPVAGWSDLSW